MVSAAVKADTILSSVGRVYIIQRAGHMVSRCPAGRHSGTDRPAGNRLRLRPVRRKDLPLSCRIVARFHAPSTRTIVGRTPTDPTRMGPGDGLGLG